MRNLFLLLFCTLWPLCVEAQNLQFRVGGGLATHYGHAENVGAFKVGLGCEFEFDQHWTLTPGIAVYGKGWKDPDRAVHLTDDDDRPLYNDDGTPRYGVMSCSAAACYLQLPVLLCYYHRLGPGRYILLGGGPYAALGIAGKTKIKGDASRHGSEKVYAEHNTFGHDGVRRFDAGVQLTAGYRLPSRITVAAEADLGCIPVATGRKAAATLSLMFTYTF